MLSDDKLIDQIKYGNERAAEELITRYYASILRYCRWHCSSVEKAEDLTQETFYKLFKKCFSVLSIYATNYTPHQSLHNAFEALLI